MLGDKFVDYNETFNLFLVTRNSAINLPSNTRNLVSIINYSVTKSGLEEKLLSIIITPSKRNLHKITKL